MGWEKGYRVCEVEILGSTNKDKEIKYSTGSKGSKVSVRPHTFRRGLEERPISIL